MIRLSTKHLADKLTLDDIFGEDDGFGLLDVQPLKQKVSPIDLAGNQFVEIVSFYEKNNRLPSETDDSSLEEKRLARRLRIFKNNPEQSSQLQKFDQYGLLKPHNSQSPDSDLSAEPNTIAVINKSELVTSLDDIFADDDNGLLDFAEPDIFSMKYVSAEKKSNPTK